MSSKTKLEIRQREIRTRLSELSGISELSDENREEMQKLTRESQDNDIKLNALQVQEEETRTVEDSEANEIRELRRKSNVSEYVIAAIENRSVVGAPAEYNAALGMSTNSFPLELLVTDEMRSITSTDGQTTQQPWVQRLMAATQSAHLGVTARNVGVGVASFPVVASGSGGATQVAKTASATESTWGVSTTEAKPKRASVNFKFSMEDVARLPGLESQLVSDMRRAVTEKMDRILFVGENVTNSVIAGLQTASINETEIKQTDKVKGTSWLSAMAAFLDGIHADGLSDLRVVLSQPANVLLLSTIQAATVSNQTVASFLRENGLNWVSRNGIGDATTAGKFGGYVGLGKGITGAAVHAIWDSGSMIRDIYNTAGETIITLNVLHDFVIPRSSNFKRLKFVA